MTATPAGSTTARTYRRTFQGTSGSIPAVRTFVTACLNDAATAADATALLDVILLTADELATNALIHSRSGARGGQFTVSLAIHPGDIVHVEVLDQGAADAAHRPLINRPAGEGGLGIGIVRALTAAADDYTDAEGHHVWADVPWQAAA